MSSAREKSFDNEAFFSALDSAREARNLTWKKLATEAGVSPSMLEAKGYVAGSPDPADGRREGARGHDAGDKRQPETG